MICDKCIHKEVCKLYDPESKLVGCIFFQSVHKRGEWKEVTKGIDRNTYVCSYCGRLINCDKPRLKLYPFCHCGADMREVGNDKTN